jgi:hypothetical protein
LNGGFGKGDISAFFVSTIPFGIVLLLFSLVALPFFSRLPLGFRITVGLIAGILSGFLWTILNRWMLGPWFGAWSFPVLYCWIIGGVVGFVSAILVQAPILASSATEQALGADSP